MYVFDLPKNFFLRMNFSNYQNRQKLRKLWGIDLYAILKHSAKFKRNWLTSFEIIIPLLICGCLTCIFMGKHNMKKKISKNTVYSRVGRSTTSTKNLKYEYLKYFLVLQVLKYFLRYFKIINRKLCH